MSNPSRRRRDSVRQTDEVIFGALDEALSVQGIDSLSAASVARNAGVSVGAIYARAESLSELSNMLWAETVGTRFLAALDAIVESSRVDDAAGFNRAITVFDTHMRDAAPAVELAVASLFDDELDEVIGAQLRDCFHQLIHSRRDSPHESASAMLVLAYFCGRAMTRCRVRRMTRPSAKDQAVLRDFWKVPHGEVALVQDAEIEFLRDSSLNQPSMIEQAVLDVVGTFGFKRGTIARIARRAGVTPGAVLLKGETKHNLITRTTDRLLLTPREVWEGYVARFGSEVTGATRAAFVKALLDPRHSKHWRINLELARLAETQPEFARFRTPNDVLQQTHQGVMFVACFVQHIEDLPFAGPFQAGSAT